MRYLIKFTKDSEIKFISHLDLLRTLQRIIKRSALPIKYSQGFNPHMAVSITQPLPVGMYSDGEYMDIEFTDKLDEDEIITKLSKSSSRGIRMKKAVFIPEKENCKNPPQSMAAVDAALYNISIRYKDTDKLEDKIKNLLKEKSWLIIKKTKSGEKEVNIKPQIKSMEYEIKENVLKISALLATGSRENLSANLLSEFIIKNTENADQDAFIDIKRIEMYGIRNNKLLTLLNFYS